MYFTHSLAGAVTIKPIIDKVEKEFTEKEKVVLWFAGITASVLPDFDLIYIVLSRLTNHRYFVTHGISIYLLMFLILYLLRYTQERKEFGRKFFKILSLVFIVGIMTHFLIDTLVGGLALLAPFSYKIIGFDMYTRRENSNWLMEYLWSRYMILEFLITFVFYYIFRNKNHVVPKLVAVFYLIAALASFVFINIFMF